jgi:hypothetical protein
MSLLELLQFIQHHHIFLRSGRDGTIRLWSPNYRVSRPVRSAIKAHSEMLLSMLQRNDINVCPNRLLHRLEWRSVDHGLYACGACERLQPSIIQLSFEMTIKQQKAS